MNWIPVTFVPKIYTEVDNENMKRRCNQEQFRKTNKTGYSVNENG